MGDGAQYDSISTDHSLVRRFREGDQDAASQLYLRYAARLQALAVSQTSTALASRFDPEDVVQSVFRTFFRRASKDLYDVPPEEELWQLLLVLALNKIRKLCKYHRAQKRDVAKTLGSPALDHLRNGEASHDETSVRMLQLVVDELLQDCTQVQRDVIHLRIDGYKLGEIANRTGRSHRTVERILRGFRAKLSDLLNDETRE